uniref:enoyl-CoA hydratase-related protein n=1 Tax=Streptomyces sp. DSM 41634 TaxID=3448656 RepID=UPI00403FE05E
SVDFTTIRHELNDGILTVVLDRPDNLNAFTVEMADELERTFVAVNDDDAVRAVIVTGEGRAFCAGMDLSSEGNVFGLDESKSPSLAWPTWPTSTTPSCAGSGIPAAE